MVLGRVLFISSDTVRYTALSRNLQPYCDGMQGCSGPEVLEAAAVVISDCSFSELTVSACPSFVLTACGPAIQLSYPCTLSTSSQGMISLGPDLYFPDVHCR